MELRVLLWIVAAVAIIAIVAMVLYAASQPPGVNGMTGFGMAIN